MKHIKSCVVCWYIIGVTLLSIFVFSISYNVQAQENKEEAKLTEIQKLKAENFQLKVQLAQARATIADRENRILSIELSNEQLVLEKEFRERLKPNEKDKFDWSSLSFKSIPTEPSK